MLEQQQQQQQQQQHIMTSTPLSPPQAMITSSSANPVQTLSPLHQAMGSLPLQGLRPSSSASSSSSTLFNLSQSAVSTPRSMLFDGDTYSIPTSVGTDNVLGMPAQVDEVLHVLMSTDDNDDGYYLHGGLQRSMSDGLEVGAAGAGGESGSVAKTVTKPSPLSVAKTRSPEASSPASLPTTMLFQPLSFEPQVTPLDCPSIYYPSLTSPCLLSHR